MDNFLLQSNMIWYATGVKVNKFLELEWRRKRSKGNLPSLWGYTSSLQYSREENKKLHHNKSFKIQVGLWGKQLVCRSSSPVSAFRATEGEGFIVDQISAFMKNSYLHFSDHHFLLLLSYRADTYLTFKHSSQDIEEIKWSGWLLVEWLVSGMFRVSGGNFKLPRNWTESFKRYQIITMKDSQRIYPPRPQAPATFNSPKTNTKTNTQNSSFMRPVKRVQLPIHIAAWNDTLLKVAGRTMKCTVDKSLLCEKGRNIYYHEFKPGSIHKLRW